MGGKSGRFADKAAGQLFWAECRLQVERKLHPFPVDQGVDGPAAQAQDNGTAHSFRGKFHFAELFGYGSSVDKQQHRNVA